MKRIALLLCLCMVLALGAGCAKQTVQKVMTPIGGSKADATVRMAYVWDPRREKAVVNEQQSLAMASEKCRAWGYERAEPFGIPLDKCEEPHPNWFGEGFCAKMITIAEFQCLGGTTTTMTTPGKGETR